MTTRQDTPNSHDSKCEYYPNGLVITKNKGTLVAEWKREKSRDSTPK